MPDIVDHQIHTKMVFIHVRKPPVKKPKTHHKVHRHENWSSWSYGRHRDYDEHTRDHEDQGDREQSEMEQPRDRQKHLPAHGHHGESHFPQSNLEENDLESNPKGREHGRYAVHEDVNDIPPNSESLSYNYEEGYKKGLETESGHVRGGQSSKFHEDRREEQEDAENDGLKEDFFTKTDAGRYLVDDLEYENIRDKRDGRRRLRRIKKA